MSLEGKVALVTGASRGIGRATAVRLARQGASVIVNYQSREDLAADVVQEIHEMDRPALAFQADVSDRGAVQSLFDRATRTLGPVDILVNNAGVLSKGDLESYDESEFDRMWQTNVKGVIYCTAAAAPAMKERGAGRIVNLSSIAALGTAFPGTTFYAATKAAVLILTRRFAYDLGPHGIRVNAVCPGFIATDLVLEGSDPEQVQRTLDSVSARAMLRRAGSPEDVAGIITFLVSDESAFMTGQVLTADGGRMDFLSRA